MSGGERVRTQGQKVRFFDVWRSWRGLLEDTYETQLLGMHIGSAWSGVDTGIVNTDAKIPIVGFGDV